MRDYQLKRTDTTVSIDKYIMRAIFCFEFNTTVIKWLIHEKRPHVTFCFIFSPLVPSQRWLCPLPHPRNPLLVKPQLLHSSHLQHLMCNLAQVRCTVVSYSNESFSFKWEWMAYFAPILSLLPLLLGGRKEASVKLSFEWKILIWIGHYSINYLQNNISRIFINRSIKNH